MPNNSTAECWGGGFKVKICLKPEGGRITKSWTTPHKPQTSWPQTVELTSRLPRSLCDFTTQL